MCVDSNVIEARLEQQAGWARLSKAPSVSAALQSRFTCRAFLDTPVESAVIRRILAGARLTPSGGNLQPWRVWALAGQDLERLKAVIRENLSANIYSDGPTEFDVYPPDLEEPYVSRRFKNGETVYEAIGIGHDDMAGRIRQSLQNFEFFGAPAAFFFGIDRRMGKSQWAELGMFLQSIMLLAREHGLHTAPLESWAFWWRTVPKFLGMPSELMLYCGMGLGHLDPDHPINQVSVGRAPLSEFAEFMGC